MAVTKTPLYIVVLVNSINESKEGKYEVWQKEGENRNHVQMEFDCSPFYWSLEKRFLK